MNERFEVFTMLINKTKRQISRLKTEEMNEFSLKSSHVNCIYYLNLHDSLTATELTELCDEDKAAISRALSHLERCGLVISSASGSAKKYNTAISLTSEGRRVAKRLSDRIASVLEEVSEGLEDEKRQIMYESLALICQNLEKISIN